MNSPGHLPGVALGRQVGSYSNPAVKGKVLGCCPKHSVLEPEKMRIFKKRNVLLEGSIFSEPC